MFIILQCAERVHEMHELANYLPPPSKKGNMYDQSNCIFHNYDFAEDEIRVATNYILQTFMQDEIRYKDIDCCSLPHKEWCELLSTLEYKVNSKRASAQIKILYIQKAVAIDFDSKSIPKVPHRKKYRTGMSMSCKHNNNGKNPNHGGI